jgi:hypothetical protein
MDISILATHGGLHVETSVIVMVAIVLGGALGAAAARFLDKSNWRNVAESRGAEIEDNDRRITDLEKKVKHLEAQIEGLIALKSEQIAHLVLEGMKTHRGT